MPVPVIPRVLLGIYPLYIGCPSSGFPGKHLGRLTVEFELLRKPHVTFALGKLEQKVYAHNLKPQLRRIVRCMWIYRKSWLDPLVER